MPEAGCSGAVRVACCRPVLRVAPRPPPDLEGAGMDLDPVLLARLQFAFSISFHILFPAFTIGLAAWIVVLEAVWLGRQRAPRRAVPVLDQDLRRRRSAWAWSPASSCRSSSAPTGAGFSDARRQRPRAAPELRGPDRVLPRGDLPRRPPVRARPRAALAALLLGLRGGARHADLGVLDPVRQQLDADARRLRAARRHLLRHSAGGTWCSTRPSPTGSRTWSRRAS